MPRKLLGSPLIQFDPTLDFMRLLWAIEHGLQRASKHMESSLGITGPQRLVLRIVAKNPGLTGRALADLLHLHPSTVTGILQRLEQQGLLVRERDAADNRRIRLKVAGGSRHFTQKSTGTVEAVIQRTIANLPIRDVEAARGVLTAIALALGTE